MGELANTVMAVMALSAPFDIPPEPHSENWCTPGYVVMLPEGREGMVTFTRSCLRAAPIANPD
jgi:hypothetical protein